ncbi:MAG: glycosyltransferase family 2 protein [Candidatus Omnitrophota bacterium]|jgi:glycosyltransferase involved in cell wall biosynthesis
MVKLSVVIPVKNEKGKIEKCLDSLRGFVDEIVVVDSLGIDGTVEVCKKYGAKVITHELEGFNMDKQRNIGIENATGDWILQTESDEVFPPDAVDKIRKAIENPQGYVAFRVFRINYFLGYPLRYAGSRDHLVRISRKEKASYVGNNLHETLKVDGPVGDIDIDICHYSVNSIAQYIAKCNFFSEAESDIFLKENDKVDIKEIKYRLTWKSLKLFWKFYIRKKGYRDGIYGLAWCILSVIGPQVKWLKIWEKAKNSGKLRGESI